MLAWHAAQRLALFLPTLFLASLAIFFVMRVLPGDPASLIAGGGGDSIFQRAQLESIRAELRLDDPLIEQYGRWILSLVNGDFGGRSLIDRQQISSQLALQVPVTIFLVLYTAVLALAVSIPLGILSAYYHRRWPDHLIRVASLGGQAIPSFVLAVLVLFMLARLFQWSPPLIYEPPWSHPWQHAQTMMLPALVLAWGFGAVMTRIIRARMLEALNQDFVRTARAKGLRDRTVLFRHAFASCLAPLSSSGGLQVAALFSGAVLVESVFGLPGVGRGMVAAVTTRDYPVVQSLAMLLVFFMLVMNLALDVLQARVDPRIAREMSAS